MPVYKLSPIDTRSRDESWQRTLLNKTCWTVAGSERYARYFVGQFTLPGDATRPTAASIHSPWQQSTVTTCVVDDPPFVVAEGRITLAGGTVFPIRDDRTEARQYITGVCRSLNQNATVRFQQEVVSIAFPSEPDGPTPEEQILDELCGANSAAYSCDQDGPTGEFLISRHAPRQSAPGPGRPTKA